MWEIDNNIICLVYFKYQGMGSDEEEIILVWPYWYPSLHMSPRLGQNYYPLKLLKLAPKSLILLPTMNGFKFRDLLFMPQSLA